MSGAASRAAGQMGKAVAGAASKANSAANAAAEGKGRESVLKKGAKRDPELYVRLRMPVPILRRLH